jgi:hypothetical protein
MKTTELALVNLAIALCCAGQDVSVFTQAFRLNEFPDPSQPANVGSILGMQDMYIHILQLGIGGEPDEFSGPTIFSGASAGIEFTWGAGQGDFSATYALTPTLPVPGPDGARGFSYKSVSIYTAQAGAPLDIIAVSSLDSDGLFTYAADARGTFFNDSAIHGSSRVWLSYEYTTVPEPSTWALLGLAGHWAFSFAESGKGEARRVTGAGSPLSFLAHSGRDCLCVWIPLKCLSWGGLNLVLVGVWWFSDGHVFQLFFMSGFVTSLRPSSRKVVHTAICA